MSTQNTPAFVAFADLFLAWVEPYKKDDFLHRINLFLVSDWVESDFYLKL